jgi:hypothetical protein
MTSPLGLTEVLAATFVDDFTGDDKSVAATIITPAGDRYRVTVEWLGDRESDD